MSLLLAAMAAGAATVGLGLRALRRGWRPRVTRLVAAGAIATGALLLVPPLGSADVHSYAAYGQMAASGLDPYAVTPNRAARLGVPAASWVESPWRHTTSIYGPAATRLQEAAARLTGSSVRGTIVMLAGLTGLAFLLTGLLLLRMASDDDTRRRVALLWWFNPLLLFELVAGAHLDAIATCVGVAALAALRRSRLLAGALGGLAVAVKAPMALVGAAMAWASRRSLRQLVALAVGAAAVAGPLYLMAGPHVLDQTRKAASRFASPSTPWRVVSTLLEPRLGFDRSRAVVATAALVFAVVAGFALYRLVPKVAQDPGRQAVRTGLVASMAWVLTAPYLLPWYDATSWALLALLPASAVDALLLVHTTTLAFSYLPGRDIPLPHSLATTVFLLHAVVSSMLLAGVMVATIRKGLRGRPEHPAAPAPQASAQPAHRTLAATPAHVAGGPRAADAADRVGNPLRTR
jgi:hypothetical protein